MVDRDLRYEITVTANGISDRENQAEEPADWQNIQLDFISAQARVSDELSISSSNTILHLVDTNGEIMLSARNGIIIDSKYKSEEPESKPTTPSTQSGGRTVWVTSSGKKYHYSSDCSNMKNPISMSISEARQKGYTACDKCA